MKQISPVAYQLQLPAHINIHPVFHVDLLMPYKVTAEYGIPFKCPAPKTIDGQEEYEVNVNLKEDMGISISANTQLAGKDTLDQTTLGSAKTTCMLQNSFKNFAQLTKV